jgi:hypothetical protein
MAQRRENIMGRINITMVTTMDIIMEACWRSGVLSS